MLAILLLNDRYVAASVHQQKPSLDFRRESHIPMHLMSNIKVVPEMG